MGILASWLKKRSEKSVADSYRRGYDFAAGALMRGEKNAAEMQSYYENAGTFSEGRHAVSYDRGIEDATDKAVKLGIVEETRIFAMF